MATIIDSLVVSLGLDASEFKKGQEQAATSFKKVKEEGVRSAKEIEGASRQTSEAVKAISREVLTLFAIFTGGKGVKQFVEDITKSNVELGKSAARMGESAQTLSAFGMAIERNGGNAQSAQKSFQSLTDSLVELKETGNTAILEPLAKLAAKAGGNLNLSESADQLNRDIVQWLAKVHETDPATANWYGKQIGLDQDAIDLYVKGLANLDAEIAKSRAFGPSDKNLSDSKELLSDWKELEQAAGKFGQTIVSDLNPGLDDSVHQAEKILQFFERLYKLLKEINEDSKDWWLTKFLNWANGAGTGAAPNALESLPDEQHDKSIGHLDSRAKRAWHWLKKKLGGESGGEAGTQPQDAGGAGQYRPAYNLGNRDLSDDVVNTVADEAILSNPASVDAVINNMFNRLGTKAYGPSGNLEEVARAPGQYAGYRKATAAEAKMIRGRIRAIASGAVPDNTNGSNEYRAAGYMGPWGRKHANSPVIGGNRFAYNPAGGRGPYASRAGSSHSTYSPPLFGFGSWASPAPAGHGLLGLRAAAAARVSHDNRVAHNTSSDVKIGTVNVHTQATDAQGIANDIGPALQRSSFAAQANYGLR